MHQIGELSDQIAITTDYYALIASTRGRVSEYFETNACRACSGKLIKIVALLSQHAISNTAPSNWGTWIGTVPVVRVSFAGWRIHNARPMAYRHCTEDSPNKLQVDIAYQLRKLITSHPLVAERKALLHIVDLDIAYKPVVLPSFDAVRIKYFLHVRE